MQNKTSRRILARTVAAKLLAEPAKRKVWVEALAAYLVQYGMEKQADQVINDIARELYIQGGHLSVSVTSARKLSDSAREELKHTLQAATSAKSVELIEQVDPGLLGGLVARTPDAVLDVSVRSKLKQLASL